ncbi:alpha/beta hydrolase [Aestuariicella hydrocarbonica]|uniref:Alpha/beta hydrolase n=1 Tax=Pseudomaricurvus hydrocarbonicus TaxID=1470433 RepID=A0A9E5JRW7_9GAMM|nr:alpha/beta hydrolase [Aestuariicella hydrocarbonica]
MLALHGWLDNSGSFFRLAPLLANHYVVALDTAGHGFSDHRPAHEPYNIWQDVAEVFAVADALGWDRFALMGHSRGGIISTLCAGTFPERITALALLDGFTPLALSPDRAPKQLAASILDNQQLRPRRVYTDREAMIRARMKGAWSLSREAARVIVERGSVEVDGGYQWSFDPRLHTASAFKLSREHIDAFVRSIQAPVKLLLAEGGAMAKISRPPEEWKPFNPQQLPGSHHFHMETQSIEIGAIVDDFFTSQANY